VAIQCVVVAHLLRILPFLERKVGHRLTVSYAVWLLTSVLLIMFAGNLLQIAAWAGILLGIAEFNDFATAFYHSTVNFTTLGYGDLVMSEKHRLLGALEAANGVLMFGLTTGAVFALMQVLIKRALGAPAGGRDR
ncbi:MAG TPA: transporter, partial [Gammaproteobacteria bacterium]|nr:transporter [Gammaproteobacteria bacterium]